jgi:hypothetical protein
MLLLQLVRGLENQISKSGQEVNLYTHYTISGFMPINYIQVDVHQWMTRASLELTCQGVLGYSVDELVDETNNHPISSAVM